MVRRQLKTRWATSQQLQIANRCITGNPPVASSPSQSAKNHPSTQYLENVVEIRNRTRLVVRRSFLRRTPARFSRSLGTSTRRHHSSSPRLHRQVSSRSRKSNEREGYETQMRCSNGPSYVGGTGVRELTGFLFGTHDSSLVFLGFSESGARLLYPTFYR
jgi:hypothetical protein